MVQYYEHICCVRTENMDIKRLSRFEINSTSSDRKPMNRLVT